MARTIKNKTSKKKGLTPNMEKGTKTTLRVKLLKEVDEDDEDGLY